MHRSLEKGSLRVRHHRPVVRDHDIKCRIWEDREEPMYQSAGKFEQSMNHSARGLEIGKHLVSVGLYIAVGVIPFLVSAEAANQIKSITF